MSSFCIDEIDIYPEDLLCLTMNYVIVKVAIGGFSMGAAIALYSATCFAIGRYGNGIPYPVNLRTVVGLSGWLPGSRYAVNYLFESLQSC